MYQNILLIPQIITDNTNKSCFNDISYKKLKFVVSQKENMTLSCVRLSVTHDRVMFRSHPCVFIHMALCISRAHMMNIGVAAK